MPARVIALTLTDRKIGHFAEKNSYVVVHDALASVGIASFLFYPALQNQAASGVHLEAL
jgi:hypothetical protein